jgi:hypothetical protein
VSLREHHLYKPLRLTAQGFTVGEMNMVQAGNMKPCEILGLMPTLELMKSSDQYHHMRLSSRRLFRDFPGVSLRLALAEFGPLMLEIG